MNTLIKGLNLHSQHVPSQSLDHLRKRLHLDASHLKQILAVGESLKGRSCTSKSDSSSFNALRLYD